MSVIRINAIEVPEGGGDELESRFRGRAGEVEKQPGFEGFELLRPTDGNNTWFVVTRWESDDAFQAWVNSAAFGRGHARPDGDRPVAVHSQLLSFDVAMSVTADQ